MTARMKLCSPALSDAATLTASQEVTGMEATNLQAMQPTDVWRTTAISGAYLTIDLGQAYAIDVIALLYTNATAWAAARVRGATTQAKLTSDSGYDSGVFPMWPALDDFVLIWSDPADDPRVKGWGRMPMLHLPAAAQSYRWWRIDIADGGNPDAYFQAGRLYLSSAWVPSVNIQYGWQPTHWMDPSTLARMTGSGSVPTELGRYRASRFSLDFLTETEMYENAFEIDRLRGAVGDVLFIPNPDDQDRLHDQTIYGTIRGARPIANNDFGIFQKSYVIEEVERP